MSRLTTVSMCFARCRLWLATSAWVRRSKRRWQWPCRPCISWLGCRGRISRIIG